jgi:uncharacterized membrane protein
MDPITGAVLGITMRWLHIFSVILVLGGLFHAGFVVAPAMALLPEDRRADFAAAVNKRFKPWLHLAVLTLIVSGLYNLITKSNIPPAYHMWFGIKMLLAMHIIAVSFLLSSASVTQERRTRMARGVVISGVLVVALAAYLRFLSNWMQS